MSYPTNNQGMIANYLPVSEFQPGHMEPPLFMIIPTKRYTKHDINIKLIQLDALCYSACIRHRGPQISAYM